MEKLKYTIVVVLCTLGVLFIILMLMPDEEETPPTVVQVVGTVQEPDAENTEPVQAVTAETGEEEEQETEPQQQLSDNAAEPSEEAEAAEEETESAKEETEPAAETAQSSGKEETESAAEPASSATAAETETVKPETQTTGGNNAAVHIPESDLSSRTIKFRSVTLDNQKISQDIFSGYDLTIVYVWGTYCSACIAEIGDYAAWGAELPDNVNLVGLVVDTYDGIDSNVSDANRILRDAGAGFTNFRTSDDLYSVTAGFQYLPSSFFVDREGHVVGGMMDGANFKQTKKRLANYIG